MASATNTSGLLISGPPRQRTHAPPIRSTRGEARQRGLLKQGGSQLTRPVGRATPLRDASQYAGMHREGRGALGARGARGARQLRTKDQGRRTSSFYRGKR